MLKSSPPPSPCPSLLPRRHSHHQTLCIMLAPSHVHPHTSSKTYPPCRLIFPPRPSSSASTRTAMLQYPFNPARQRHCSTTLISCKSSSFYPNSSTDEQDPNHYLEASLLVSETLLHHRMRRQASATPSTTSYPSSWRRTLLFPFPDTGFNTSNVQGKESSLLIGQAFLRGFQSPTIFLKISCDPEFFLLPIIVGEIAVERLIDSLHGNDNGDCPDQFQFLQNVVEELQYKVQMVRITQRVGDTYFSRLYFGKAGDDEVLSVDARPSDAINVAHRCKAPIYVSKEIVFTDAIRIGYGMGALRGTKSVYDVSLDSAVEGPDSITEELDLVKNLNLAVTEERYNDAAMWRDKLMELRKSRQEHK